MTTIASAKPTWASCGVPATTSPTAQTPSARGAHVLVDDHETALVDRHPGALGQEALGTGSPADRDDDGVDGQLLAVAEGHDGARSRRVGGVALQL